MRAPLSVLLVEPATDTRALLANMLRAAGCTVFEAIDFQHAKQAFDASPPDVLITELRLGAYNGLHLVLRARLTRASITAIVTARAADPVLQREAEQLHASFVVKDAKGQWLATIGAMFRSTMPAGSTGAN